MIDGRGQVVITDFGLASVASEVAYRDIRSGTPAYMAPEQLAGVEVSQRSDIYALGLLLFELFAGVPPHRITDREQLQKLRQAGPPALTDFVADVDPALDLVVQRCLDPIPGSRPHSALAVAASLPGGDPLAVALAMGETPSPELVAAAEPDEIMRPRIAAACLIVLSTFALLSAWIAGSASILAPSPRISTPARWPQTARDTLGKLGYPGTPAWSNWSLEADFTAVANLQRLNRSVIQARVAQDPPVYFWYRASPNAIVKLEPILPGLPPMTTRHLECRG